MKDAMLRVVGVIRHMHPGGWGGRLTFNHLPGTRREMGISVRERGGDRTREERCFKI